jgi:lactoylglutathione lyase
MAKAIHMMVRVLDAEKSIDFYERAFGLTIADRFDFDDFTLVYLRNPEVDFEVELTVNKGRTEPYDHGDAYGHVAFAVEDLDGEHARFEEAGFCTQPDQRVPSRRRADGAFLFRAGPRRVQDRDAAAARPLPLAASATWRPRRQSRQA